MKTKDLILEVVQLPSIEDKSIEEIVNLWDDMKKKFVIANKALGIANKLKNPEDKKKYRAMAFANLNKIRAWLKRVDKKLEDLAKKEEG